MKKINSFTQKALTYPHIRGNNILYLGGVILLLLVNVQIYAQDLSKENHKSIHSSTIHKKGPKALVGDQRDSILSIVGGDVHDVYIGDAPWVVSFEFNGIENPNSGAIVGCDWVVTAAHVVDNIDLNNTEMIVHAGANNRLQNQFGQRVKVEQIIIHNDYQATGKTAIYDIALLKLESPLTYNDEVQPIEYASPSNCSEQDIAPGTEVMFYGWGAGTDKISSPFPEELQGATIEIISNTEAKDELCTPRNHDPGFSELSLYSGQSGPQMELGDSGGPVVLTKSNGEKILVGVNSWTCWPKTDPTVVAHVRNLHSFLDDNITPCCEEGPDVVIPVNSSVQYDDSQKFGGDLIISTGAQVYVTATLMFIPNHHIIIERGGRLIVDEGTLTKCPNVDAWGGVIVKGNSNKDQPDPYANLAPDDAGVVILKNGATISWARNAISTNYYGAWTDQDWGGVVVCDDSYFLNNARAAEFMKFTRHDNKSHFVNCYFDGLSNIDGDTKGVTIWNTSGINFINCTFMDMEKDGIRTYDAGVNVLDDCEFEGNKHGIFLQATYPYGKKTLIGQQDHGNRFRGNHNDVKINSTSYHYVDIIDNLMNHFVTSIDVTGTSFYNIRYNAISSPYSTIGAYLDQSGELMIKGFKYIARNFFGTGTGIYALGENRRMRFWCNDFGCGKDFYLTEKIKNNVVVPGQIEQFQGEVNDGADNCFTDPGTVPDIVTVGNTVSFTYYTTKDRPCKIPMTPGNYHVQKATDSRCADDPYHKFSCPDNPTDGDYTNLLTQLADMVAAGQEGTAEYADLVEEKDCIQLKLVQQKIDNGDVDGAIGVLDEDGSLDTRFMKYGVQVDAERYGDALNTLIALPDSIPEVPLFKQIQYINLDRFQSTGEYLLSASDSLLLRTIAESDAAVRSYARALFSLLTGIDIEDGQSNPPGYEPVSGVNSSNDIEDHVFTITPNPVTDKMVIRLKKPLKDGLEMSIYSMNGRLQLHVPLNSEDTKVSTAKFAPGIYMARLFDKKRGIIDTKRIVIIK